MDIFKKSDKSDFFRMTEEVEQIVSQDRITINVISEAVSRGLMLVAGLVSSSLLVRAIDISWSLSDYAHVKVLMYWSAFLTTFVLLGLSTAVIKVVSEHAHDRKNLGSVIGVAYFIVTLTFLGVSFITLVLAEQIGFLVGDTPAITAELRVLWIVVLVAILPSAYILISKSVFSGIQRMKKSLYVDIVYNASRIIIILYLFITNTINTNTVLWMYLITTLFGFVVAAFTIRRDLRAEGIAVTFSGWKNVTGPLLRIGLLFVTLGLLAAFTSSIVPLLVDYYGTDTDMARYAIAQSTITTLKAFLMAPFAVLLPNIAGLFARGELEKLRNRFEDSYKILVSALIFGTVCTIFLGRFFLGALYGVRALDSIGGISAATFMITMAPILFVIPVSVIYSTVIFAFDKLKLLLAVCALSVTMQTIWIIVLQPHFGVIAMAYLWVAIIPIFIIYHYYSKRELNLYIPARFWLKATLLSILFIIMAAVSASLADFVVDSLSFLPLFNTTTVSSLAKLTVGIPLWYVFIALCLATRVMGRSDLDNLRKFMKVIPPIWWISKPLLNLIERTGIQVSKKMAEARH